MGENCYVLCTCESTSSEIGVGGGGGGWGRWPTKDLIYINPVNLYKSKIY